MNPFEELAKADVTREQLIEAVMEAAREHMREAFPLCGWSDRCRTDIARRAAALMEKKEKP